MTTPTLQAASMRWHVAATLVAMVAWLAGCTTYQARPLPAHPSLSQQDADILIDRSQLPLPELKTRPFHAHAGLDMDDIAMLAVVNNPDLKVLRADASIARAQAFGAGLLPDPQLGAARDVVQNPVPGATSAFSVNLTEDINALIRHHFDSQAGKLDARKTDLNVLWQEWQVVAKARTLYIKLVEDQRLLRVVQQNRALFADRYRRTRIAMERGLLAFDAVSPHLTALQDIDKQLHDLERQHNTDYRDLRGLLGLAPEAPILLHEGIELPAVAENQITALLPDLPRRRPDLIALQYGYQAQDQHLRAAIAGQFPTFTVGFTRARDTSNSYTNGVGITLSLPIFNGNRGAIAVEAATRQKLYDEYQNRLNSADSDVHRILAEQRINARQLQEVNQGIADLSSAAAKAEQAFRAHDIDALAYASLQAALLAKQIEQINLEQSMLQQRVALQALLGGELPVAFNGETTR